MATIAMPSSGRKNVGTSSPYRYVVAALEKQPRAPACGCGSLKLPPLESQRVLRMTYAHNSSRATERLKKQHGSEFTRARAAVSLSSKFAHVPMVLETPSPLSSGNSPTRSFSSLLFGRRRRTVCSFQKSRRWQDGTYGYGKGIALEFSTYRERKTINWEVRFVNRDRTRLSSPTTNAQHLEEAAAPLNSGNWEGPPSAVTRSPAIVNEFTGREQSQRDLKNQVTKGVFPGNVRRAEVRIPGLVLRIQVSEVLQELKGGSEEFMGALSSAAAEGLTMVILESGVEGEGGARLYEAACAIKSVLRGRAELLVSERVDIAAAAGADGVVLSDEGLPPVVARRMMQSAVPAAAVLSLVARTVSSSQSAVSATALEGADLLLLQCSDVGDLGSHVTSVCKEVSIPVFLEVNGSQSSLNEMVLGPTLNLLQAGASGLVFRSMALMDHNDVSSYVAAVSSAMSLAIQQQSNTQEIESGKASSNSLFGKDSQDSSLPISESSTGLALDLDLQAKLILEEERKLLTAMVDVLQAASPEMEEISLLEDAVKQLDELFLLVIVGEFNSGKSSVINALLGKRFLKEGVLPTTNEITVLRHSGDGYEGEERSERHPDGHFLRYLSADLLKQMDVVDTPGTNVILQRQQRLTEEFVPRADLVLFVLSVDRPLTKSEVTFLQYIRQWGKKIIFILNKSDIISERKELEEVTTFVKENAESLLSVEQAPVYPVSARRAILAKQAVTTEAGSIDKKLLLQDSYWGSSGFQELEDFIQSFLGGSSDAGAERLRLKLETPLGIGMALLGACDRQLSADIVKADTDLRVLDQINQQLNQYQQSMQADAALQRQRTTAVITAAKARAGKFVDSILRLSNVEAIIKYLLGPDGARSMPVSGAFDSQVIGSAVSDIRKILEDHRAWLKSNTARQANMYGELVKSRWPDKTPDRKFSTANKSQLSSVLESFKDKLQKTDDVNSIAVLEGFDVQAAEILLEQEIREVVLTTCGGFGVAGVSASVLTLVLPSTLEDLVALGVCTAGGFVGVWSLPSRRQDVKNKVNNVADSVARQLGEAMQVELEQNLQQLRADVTSLTASYRTTAEAERTRIVALRRRLEELDRDLRGLRQKVQNLGT